MSTLTPTTTSDNVDPDPEDVEMKPSAEGNNGSTSIPSFGPETVTSPEFASSFVRHSNSTSANKINRSENLSFEFEELKETLNEPNFQRKDHLARADICHMMRRPKLTVNKVRIKEKFGFDVKDSTYFWPEEALYLIETGKLEVYLNGVALSVQRARSLFLHSNSQPDPDEFIISCDVEEYAVYKNLSKYGYRLKRREPAEPRPKVEEPQQIISDSSTQDSEEVMCLDPSDSEPLPDLPIDIRITFPDQTTVRLDDTVEDDLADPILSARGIKRKASQGLLGEDDSSTSSHQSLADRAEKYYAEISSKEQVDREEPLFEIGEADSTVDEEMPMTPEPVPGPSSASHSDHTLYTPYTVTEVDSDSDIEIVEEVIHSHTNVSIEEIGTFETFLEHEEEEMENLESDSSQDYDRPSTSKVIVDLVSDTEDQEMKDFDSSMINFIPNSRVQFTYPPSHLLPHNIPIRDGQIYSFDVKFKADLTTSEENKADKASRILIDERVQCKSWKEWRQVVMAEARDVLNESLVGSSVVSSGSTHRRLHQWGKNSRNVHQSSQETIRIPFDMFIPTPGWKKVGKYKLGTEIPPDYRVAIVRNDQEIIDFCQLDSIGNDETPILFGIVSEDDVVFVTSNMNPLPSLF